MPDQPHSVERLRRRVIFRGHVQGVGFRYTTATIARRLPLTGYVMNLPDGSVEVVVETDRHTYNEFLSQIGQTFRGHIEEVIESDLESDESFAQFEIRYHRR